MITPPRAALAGLVAGLVALGSGEVLARLVPRPSLVLAVGEVVIALVPPTVSDSAISMFGRSDKTALVAGIVVTVLLIAAALAVAARRRPWVGAGGFAALAAIGVAAGIARTPSAPAATVLVGAGGAALGLGCLRTLLRGRSPAPAPDAAADGSRRRLLRLAAVSVAAAALAGAAGRRLSQRVFLGTDPGDVSLRQVAIPLPAVSPATSFAVAGVSPVVTPNRSFYRIDTALMVPRVDIDGWRLQVTGLVDRPLSLSYADLAAMAQVEADVTISCVSNDVGGELVGNARWQGVPLADLLAQAGPSAEATQVVGRSLDGWTAGFPTRVAVDGRAAMVALGMNGRPLPLAHGFPARLVIPGLYGYVSATKWLREIELTTLEAFNGYWVPRGWAKDGPIKMTSRIDVPHADTVVQGGRIIVAGMAWAPHRGISAVEVSVDAGPWTLARLADTLGVDSWRQWRYDWDARPGSHELRVRATDGTGEVQTGVRSPLKPSGATGHHTVRVTVR